MASWAGVTSSCGRGASGGSPDEPYSGEISLPLDPLESGPPSALLQVLRLACVSHWDLSLRLPPPIPGSGASGRVGVGKSGFCPE